jgi:hypothetical protein
VLLTPRVQYEDHPGYQKGSKWNILGYHQVARLRVLGDIPVGYVWSAINPNRGDVRIADRGAQTLVGHEDRRNLQAFGGAEYEIFDVPGRCVGVDPDSQTLRLERHRRMRASNLQRPEQSSTCCRDVPDRFMEGRFVSPRRGVEPADLPNELQRGIVQLLLGRHLVWAPQLLDVSAHDGLLFNYFPPECRPFAAIRGCYHISLYMGI